MYSTHLQTTLRTSTYRGVCLSTEYYWILGCFVLLSVSLPLLVPGSQHFLTYTFSLLRILCSLFGQSSWKETLSEWLKASFICPMGKVSLLGKGHMVHSLSHSCLNVSSLCLFPFLIPLLPSTSSNINQALYSRLRLGLRRLEQATLIISPWSAFLFSWLAVVIPSADLTSFTPLACPLQEVCPLAPLWSAYSQSLVPHKKLSLMLSYT